MSHSSLESIYIKSPIWVQNLLINIKGFSVERDQRGGFYPIGLKKVIDRNNWSADQFRSYQEVHLKKILSLAEKSVPYYRTLFKNNGFNSSYFKNLSDLKRLPLLSKNSLRQNPFIFVNEFIDKKGLRQFQTTGTTGTPLRIYATKKIRQYNYAFFDAYQLSLGIHPREKRATFGGRLICNYAQKKPPYWRYVAAQKNLMFSSYHLNDDNMNYYVDKLLKYQPKIIDAYPSSIYTLAKFTLKNGQSGLVKPKLIITSSETLFDEQREVIEKAFGCPVADQYGSVEMCIFVGQCSEGSYHYRPDFGIVELVNQDGRPVEPGEIGEIVCTGLINDVMPLIRYRIGDLGIFSNKTCSCGLKTPIFKKIVGRIDDMIITPDGRRIGRMTPILKGFPVREAQYIQRSINELKIKIVKDQGYCDNTTSQITTEIRKRIGTQMVVTFEFVDKIDRGKGGKLKTVISEVLA